MAEPMRRLELRLPVNHPVWSLPQGSRSKIVIEWLDIGRRLSMLEDSINSITEKINFNENSVRNSDMPEQHDAAASFDKNAFLSHFK